MDDIVRQRLSALTGAYLDEKPESLTKAKEECLTVWGYLRDNPNVRSKLALPDDMYNIIQEYQNHCPLCAVFLDGEDSVEDSVEDCGACPLVINIDGSKTSCTTGIRNCVEKHPYNKWLCDPSEDTRRQAAADILALVEAWNPEETHD